MRLEIKYFHFVRFIDKLTVCPIRGHAVYLTVKVQIAVLISAFFITRNIKVAVIIAKHFCATARKISGAFNIITFSIVQTVGLVAKNSRLMRFLIDYIDKIIVKIIAAILALAHINLLNRINQILLRVGEFAFGRL